MNDEWSNNWPQAPVTTNPLDLKTQDELLIEWDALKKILAKAKEDEMTMRKYIVSRAFPEKTEGVNKVELGAGYELKSTIKYNYNLSTDINKVSDIADKIASVGNIGSVLAERLFKWSADLVLSEYKKLDTSNDQERQIKQLVDQVLTITDGAPTLEIKEPKKKK